jgi:uncharacterized protein YbjT (DUF2867 family)
MPTQSSASPILITGIPGNVGGVGRAIVENLRRRGLPVRALARREDQRTDALRALGAEIVTGDLTRPEDVSRALEGCRRVYFGMSVSAQYLEATAVAAAVARQRKELEVLVNISQLTVSQMSLTEMTGSPQHQQHWLAEQVLNWSGIPVVHVRPTVFLQHPFFTMLAAASIARSGTIRLPFGAARTSPIDAQDVADVIAEILANPAPHLRKIYELTGPRSEDMRAVAAEYAEALGREISYVDVPPAVFRDELRGHNFPEHLYQHFAVMAKLHAENRYDRLTHDVDALLGRSATSVRAYVAKHAELWRAQGSAC